MRLGQTARVALQSFWSGWRLNLVGSGVLPAGRGLGRLEPVVAVGEHRIVAREAHAPLQCSSDDMLDLWETEEDLKFAFPS